MGLLLHRCGDDDRHGDSVSFGELFLGAEAVSGHSFLCSPECGHVSDETVQMEPNPEGAASANRQQKNPDAVLDYLQHSLSADGKAGSFVFVGNDGYVDKKYTQILILFGQYSTLAGLHYDGDMALFVPEAHREDAGGSVTISGREIETVANAGVQFDLFHPLHYIEPDNPLLSDTLILCTRDFQAVNKMFPWWGLSGEVFGRMVLVDPSDAEIEQLQKLFYEQKGILYTGISTEDFTQITTSASIRAHRLYILFYLLSGALLVILLICNIIRIIETHVAEYTVHHLYGAYHSEAGGRLRAGAAYPSNHRDRICHVPKRNGAVVCFAAVHGICYRLVPVCGRVRRKTNRDNE